MVFPTGWLNYKEITIQNAEVAGDLTDFPAVYWETDTDLTKARADGFDFVVTESDGTTVVPYERVLWNDSTGEIIIWIKTDPLGATNVTYRLYYNNASETVDQQDRDAVWTDGYIAVYHMNQADIIDSTGNGNTGTNSGTSNDTGGKVGDCRSFDGTNDYITVPSPFTPALVTGDAFTVEIWRKSAESNSVEYSNWDDQDNFGWWTDGNYYSGDGGWTIWSGGPLTDDNWHYYVMEKGSGNSIAESFRDGSTTPIATEPAFTTTFNTPQNNVMALGGDNRISPPNVNFGGELDEMRISEVARGDDYRVTTYDNINAPSTFWVTGAEIDVVEVTVFHTTDSVLQAIDIEITHTTDSFLLKIFNLSGVTRDSNLNVVGNCRVILFKQDDAAQASRIYTIIDHVNSDGSGNFTFSDITDDDSQYMVYAIKLDSPQIRGLSNDDLQPA